MDIAALESYLTKEADDFPGKVNFLYADLNYRKWLVDRGAQERVTATGIIKIPLLLALYHKMENDMINPEEEMLVPDELITPDTEVFEYGGRTASVQELATWMAIKGDNTATNVLIEYMGFDYINKAIESYGLEHTHFATKMLDPKAAEEGRDNYTTPLDIYQCLSYFRTNEKTHLYAGIAISLLRHYRDSSCLLRYLYDPLTVAHMTGMRSDMISDCGVFDVAHDTFFLGVFVSQFDGVEDGAKKARQLIGRMGRKTFVMTKKT